MQINPTPDRNKTNQTIRGCLVNKIEFDEIEIHQRNLTLKKLECNLTTQVGRNSFFLLKPKNVEFLELWNSLEFKEFHQIHSGNQTSLRNLSLQFYHIP